MKRSSTRHALVSGVVIWLSWAACAGWWQWARCTSVASSLWLMQLPEAALLVLTLLTAGMLMLLAHESWRHRPVASEEHGASFWNQRFGLLFNMGAAVLTLAFGMPLAMMPACG